MNVNFYSLTLAGLLAVTATAPPGAFARTPLGGGGKAGVAGVRPLTAKSPAVRSAKPADHLFKAAARFNGPPEILDQTFSVAENTANGTSVATVVATDPDVGETLTYEISAGNIGDAFAINFTTGELTVNNVAMLDYETFPTYTLTVDVSDGSFLVSGTVTVNVTNLTETPTVTSFTPTNGDVGTSVSITGTNFIGAGSVTVRFNGTTATSVTVNSSTNLTAQVPSGATSGTISVTNDDGTGTSSASYTVGNFSPPVVTGFSPSSGAVGASISITGSNFLGATGVAFNGTAASFTVNASNSITATVPSGATSGTISVTNPYGTGTSIGSFTVAVPTVAGFTPTQAATGSSFTITGSNFTGATAVTINNVAVSSFTVNSATSITATVPANGTTGVVRVTTPTGTGTSAATFKVLPTITSFTPTGGIPGDVVTITGSGYLDATAVRFNGVNAASFTVNSATSITATAPTGVTTGKISVVNVGGTATSTGNFTLAPYITSFTPGQGSVGSVVIVTGAGYVSGSTTVRFNGTNATTTFNSSTQLTATVPAGATSGVLSVTNANGTSSSSSSFTVTTGAAPTISSFTPTSGVQGVSVTITGTNFTGATAVRFNNTAAASYTVNSATSITAVAPAGFTSGRMYVTTANGMAQSASSFSLATSTVTSFTPTSGSPGTSVAITGTNFNGATAVNFGGVAATSYTVNSNTSITATVPTGAVTGTIQVVGTGGTGTSAGTFTVTASSIPTISSFTPTSGNVGTSVTITGTNFTGTTAVAFNGTAASFTVNSATQITASVPTGATTGTISVTNSGGTATSGTSFTVTTPAPTISSFTPTTGVVGTSVTITGTNFTGASAVAFNGTAATSYTVNSATQITATVPAGATTGTISVTTAGGTATSGTSFTVTPAPTVTSFTPTSGLTGASVTITGTDFTGATAVRFNGTNAASYTVNSATQITATVPASGTTGPLSVVTAAGTGTSGTSFTKLNAPVINNQTFSVAENTSNGTAVGTVAASDPDAGETLTYAITAGNGSGAFAINSSTGQLTVANSSALNFEATTSFALTVQVTDNGSPTTSASATVTVNVTDVNEAPVVAAQSFSIAENSANATAVGTVAASDPDAGSVLTYSITAGNTGGAFSMVGNQLTVATPAALDFETNPTFSLTVEVSDGTLASTATMTVNLTDVNETPSISAQSFTIAEDAATGTTVGTVAASDPDAGTSLTYSILSGNVSSAFTFVGNQLRVNNGAALNFEVRPTYSLTVRVSDGALTAQATVTVNLTDVNEAPFVAAQSFSLAENSANGTAVGTVSASDPDAGATLSYSITGGNPGGAFAINSSTGEVTVANGAGLNFETTPSLTFTVQVSDGTLASTATMTVNLTDVNETPSISAQTFSVAENAADNTVVGTVAATDPDAGATLDFAILSGNTNGAFVFVDNQLTVANSAALDFETTPSFSLTVQVTDGSLTATTTVTVNVTNGNEAPSISAQSFSLAENTAASSVVGTVAASDPDAGTTLTYTITGGNTGGAFAFSGDQLTVANAAALDFETNPTFNLTVQVSDGALTASAAVTVNVTNVNEMPTIDPASFSVAENSANGTTVGTMTASDPDAGTTFSYAITGGNAGGVFAINSVTGAITVANGAALNYEATTSYNLTVEVSDGALSASTTVTVSVTDENEAPSLSGATYSLAENTANGTVVGGVTGSDPDAGASLTYSITAGNTGGAFAIDASTGQITVANSAILNYETNPSFSLTVEVSDGALTASATVAVNLTNENEQPTISGATFTLNENTATGAAVGTVTASDPDGTALTYAITAGNTAGAFAINAGTGAITVADGAALDFETNPSFSLTVEVTDGSLTASAAVTVNLTDVNEAPSISAASFSVAENTATNTVVGTVTGTDPDAGETLTYAIIAGNTGGAFAINGSTGAIRVASSAALNYEVRTSYTLTVRVSDGNLTDTAPVTISVTDVNETPSIAAQSFNVSEGTANGTTVGTVVASDPDAGTSLTYSITSGNTGGAFAFSGNQLVVANTAAIDFDTTPSFSLAVEVTDGALTASATVTVNVTNVNSAPSIADQTFPVAENSANGSAVGTVVASDPDAGTTLTYDITAGNGSGAFAINPTTGAITVANGSVLNYEATTSYALTVEVSDGALTASATVMVNVTDVNEAPSISAQTFSEDENTANGTATATVFASDPDAGASLTYSITAGNTGGAFTFVGNQLTIANSAALDYETNPTFSLTVEVSDGALTSSATITVDLNNVNEMPSLNSATFSLAENTPNGSTVGTLVGSDPDAGTSLTYSILSGNTAGAFSIVGSQLRVANTAALDFETLTSFSLTVQVSDGLLTATNTVTVNLTNVNEAPSLSGAAFSVAEGAANGTVLGAVTGSDPDAGTSLAYSITAGNAGSVFAINATTGQITVANGAGLDFETTPSYSLTVRVSDGSLAAVATVTVSLTNVNEAPSLTNRTFSLPENSATGTNVGTITGSDPDAGTVLTYSITAGNGAGAFAINAITGQITVDDPSALNFEVTPSFVLTVETSDGDLTASATVTVNLSNVNEDPSIAAQTFSIAENSANGTTVGSVTASDPDAGTSLTYSILSGNTGNAFSFTGNQLRINNVAMLDFETTTSFSLTVQVSDGALTATNTVTVDVTNVNEAPSVTPRSFTVAENTANGTTLGSITATDPDAGTSLSYSITGGNTSGAFTMVGNQLRVANSAALDFETTPSFSLLIRVADNGSPSLAASSTMTVTVTDVNEAPSIAAQSLSVPENSATGTVVGALTASDPDAGTSLSYAIIDGDPAGIFSVSGNQILVADPLGLDYESTPVYSLVVEVSDGALTAADTITVNVTNVSEIPTITSFVPNSGAVGMSITINGSGFIGAGLPTVRFNGVLASAVSVASSTTLTATVPSGATTGKISVANNDGSVLSTANFVVGVIGTPTVSSFTPTSGQVGASVTITGTNFIGASVVRFNGVAVSSFIVNSATSISTTVPSGATTGKVSVVTPGGTATSVANFTVQVPTISTFTPSSAVVGATVSINGANFLNVLSVEFNGAQVLSYTVNSATNITAFVPNDATTGKISITTISGRVTSAGTFKVLPTISSFSPGSGVQGDTVTITGTGYLDATSVKFATITTTNFSVVDANTIRVVVPAGAPTGKITVVTPGGSIASATNFVMAPFITAFTPDQGAIGSVVIITGTNFVNPTTVSFNGVNATTTYNSTTQLTATIPAGATTGPLTVTNANGSSTTTSSFTIVTGAIPTITSFTPTTGVYIGTLVTINGTNLGSATAIRFNNITTTSITVVSATQVRANVPAGATSGKLYVITPNGMAASATNLTITQPPTVTSFTPGSGPVGTSVTITGTVFTGATAVRFGGVAATTFTVNSASSITAVVPAGAVTGNISVTTAAGTGTSAGTFTVTAVRDAAIVAAPVIEPLVVEVYPNPATEFVNIRVSGGTGDIHEVELVDATGRAIQRIALSEGAATVPVTGLSKGVYMVRVGNRTQRLVLQ